MPSIERVKEALETQEIRNACAVLDHVHEAMMLIDTLEPHTIEAIREEFAKMARERTGPRSALKQAWAEYTMQAFRDAQRRKQQDAMGMYEDAIRY